MQKIVIPTPNTEISLSRRVDSINTELESQYECRRLWRLDAVAPEEGGLAEN